MTSAADMRRMEIKSDVIFTVALLTVSVVVAWCLLSPWVIYRQHKAIMELSELLGRSDAQAATAIRTANDCFDGATVLVADERSRREQAERDLWVCVEGLRWPPASR